MLVAKVKAAQNRNVRDQSKKMQAMVYTYPIQPKLKLLRKKLPRVRRA